MLVPRHREFNIRFEENEQETEEMEMIETMLTSNKVHLLYDALGQTIQPATVPTKKKKKVAGTPSPVRRREDVSKSIHSLFDEYLSADFLDHLKLDYKEVYDTFAERAKPLKEEIEEDREIIVEIIDSFVTRMVFNLVTQDKVAVKVRSEMVERVEALYDHKTTGEPIEGVKNDFVNYDYVNSIINQRCREARDQAHDKIQARFAEPKRRGRHPKVRVEDHINEIEAIAGEYIAKRLSIAQAAAAVLAANGTHQQHQQQRNNGIDLYPIFEKTLATYDKCIPKQNNHGFYIQRLMHFIRVLDSRVWPLHGLMSVANNLNYCIHAESVKMRFERTKRRFYCCYSGLEIEDGDTVTCLRVVENDAQRLKEWRENPMNINRPFEAPEFTRSVCAFYMKKELCCASTLFFTPFSETYKAHFPEYFKKTATEPLPVKKSKRKPDAPLERTTKKPKLQVDESLFESMAPYATKTLRAYMAKLCREWEDQLSYKEEIWPLLEAVNKKTFTADLERLIALFVDSEADVKLCYDALLDFTEAVLLPEKKVSPYASIQKNRTILTFLYATRQHIKARAPEASCLFTQEMPLLHSYRQLFVAFFHYLAEHEIEPFLMS